MIDFKSLGWDLYSRFIINNDDDGHWYLMPEDNRLEFEDYVSAGEDIPENIALSLGGHPSLVSFSVPTLEF